MADQKLRVDITAKDRSRQAFSRVQKSLGRLKSSLLSVKGLIGAAFGALAVRALVKFVTNTVKASDAIVKTADAIGLSTDKLQELRFVWLGANMGAGGQVDGQCRHQPSVLLDHQFKCSVICPMRMFDCIAARFDRLLQRRSA